PPGSAARGQAPRPRRTPPAPRPGPTQPAGRTPAAVVDAPVGPEVHATPEQDHLTPHRRHEYVRTNSNAFYPERRRGCTPEPAALRRGRGAAAASRGRVPPCWS